MIAVAGVDMAAWDALARAAAVPLCVLLGGSIGPVPAYNSNGLWLRPPGELATEAVQLRDEGGFKGLKLRLGRQHLRDDVLAIEAVREAVGTDMSLMIDFNQALPFGDALERCHAIDNLGLAWIEEPIVYDNLEGYARLAAELKTPIQIGENFYGPRALFTALQMKACDYVMPDFMRIGGVSGWIRAAAIAGAAGIPISTHLYPEVGAHLLRVTETAHWLEWQDWANPVLQQPYQIQDGVQPVSRRKTIRKMRVQPKSRLACLAAFQKQRPCTQHNRLMIPQRLYQGGKINIIIQDRCERRMLKGQRSGHHIGRHRPKVLRPSLHELSAMRQQTPRRFTEECECKRIWPIIL